MSIEIIVFRFAYYKAKTLLSMAPFSIILVGDFCVIIYSNIKRFGEQNTYFYTQLW